VLVEQQAEHECERIAAEQLVGAGVLGVAELGHRGGVPHAELATLTIRRPADLRTPGADRSARPVPEP